MHRSSLVVGLAAIALTGGAIAQSRSSADATRARQAFDVQILHRPTVVAVGDDRQLLYEVHLTSFARVPLKLTALIVEDPVTGRMLHRFEGDALADALGGPGMDSAEVDKRIVATGRRAVVYVGIGLDRAPPVRLRHRVEFDIQTATGPVEAAVVGDVVDVAEDVAPLLGPPLAGGPWVAVYDPRLANGHRRYLYAVGGKARIPGRFAIDWMAPNVSLGQALSERPAPGAGASVLAVTDATVVGLRDGVVEVPPSQQRALPTLSDAPGNYVALDLGDGRYAFYEHLAPGLSVKLGSRVRRGQAIGRVGSTGQAGRPHLHFHVADANSPFEAEGEPYRLVGARVVGAYSSIAAFEAGGAWQSIAGQPGAASLPLPNSVVMFNKSVAPP